MAEAVSGGPHSEAEGAVVIDPHGGPVGLDGSVFGNSDEAIWELEKAGLLGNVVPKAEPTPEAGPHLLRFRMRHKAERLASEGNVRDAVRYAVLSRVPVVRAHPKEIAAQLRIPEPEIRALFEEWAEVGWTYPTNVTFTIDPLGEATRDAWGS